MRRFTALVIAAIGVLGAAPADAADPPRRYPPAVLREPPPPRPIASGWYLRGDLGYRWNVLNHAEPPTGFPAPADEKLSGGWSAGIGAGFKADSLRVDVTADYGTRFKYTGSTAPAADTTAKLQAYTGLINAYYEPYTWDRLTPYVGAGVGFAYVQVSDYTSSVVPPLTPVPASRKWNLAYALMVGTSFNFSRQVLLDVGYRYLSIGTADTSADAAGRVMSFKDLAAHEVRIGVRLQFSDPPNMR